MVEPKTHEEVERMVGEKYEDEYCTYYVAGADKEFYGDKINQLDGILAEFGICDECAIMLISDAKYVICPKCGEKEYLT